MPICVDVSHKDEWPQDVLAPVDQTGMVARGFAGSLRTFPSRASVSTDIVIVTSSAYMMVTEKHDQRNWDQLV